MVAIAQAGLPDDASGYTVPKDDCPHVKLGKLKRFLNCCKVVGFLPCHASCQIELPAISLI